MKITNAATYAISAAAYLASAPVGEFISNTEICEAYQMPDRFVLQVMRQMLLTGIVKCTRGVFGGCKLAKPANKITLLEIIEVVDGPIGVDRDDAVPGLAKIRTAPLEKALAAIEADARKRLDSITPADLRAAKAAQ